MDITALLLLILVSAFVILFVSRPFSEHEPAQLNEANQDYSALLAERERILDAIQELDTDHSLQKIPAGDYDPQRTELFKAGMEVLRKIDEISNGSVTESQQVRDSIEKTEAPIRAEISDEELEDMLARRLSVRKGRVASFCPNCGKPVLLSDSFCPSCGHAIK